MILIGRGADSEANSFITLDQLDALKFLPAIKRDGVGHPLVSPELAEQVFMPAGDTLDNLPIRGVLLLSTQIHDQVRIIAGRMFAPGLNEIVIGKSLVNQYPGCSLGADLKVGRRIWNVVGVSKRAGVRLNRRCGPICIACRRMPARFEFQQHPSQARSRRGCSLADSAKCR